MNIQDKRNNLIFGEKTILLCGKPFIREIFCDTTFFISTTNFFQVNTKLAEHAVKSIINWFKKDNSITHILDCYCGIGTISLPLAKSGYQITGIEINKESVKQAIFNAKSNNLDNVTFHCGDVTNNSLLLNYQYQGLVIDPPRKGLAEDLIRQILSLNFRKIVYLSCNPSTLARDLNMLCEKYSIESVQPFDFFPQTTHIECLAFLTSNF